MAIPRKPGPAEVTNLLGKFPDMPSVPADMIQRFDSLRTYEAAMKAWWQTVSTMLQDHVEQIQAKFDKLDRA